MSDETTDKRDDEPHNNATSDAKTTDASDDTTRAADAAADDADASDDAPRAAAADDPDADAGDDEPRATDAADADADDVAAKNEAPDKAGASAKKQRSALSSALGLLAFIGALAGGFYLGQWIKSDGSGGSAALEDARRFKVKLRGDEPQKGPDDALVTIIEFADYQCPYCARAVAPLEEAIADHRDDVRLVYKHFPLQMHTAAGPAAKAAWAAHQQGEFWPVHEHLFESKAKLDGLDALADKLGLDRERLRRDMVSPEAAAAVDDDFKSGAKIGVTGTPQFIVNGHRYKGALDAAQWREIIERELDEAEDVVDSGVPRSQVYAKLMEGALEHGAAEPAARRPGEPDPTIAYAVPRGDDRPSLGPDDALVSVVVFSDFQCPYCSKLAPVMHDLVQTYGVRVVFRQLPLAMHAQAKDAAKAALAAHRQGKFWEMHDAMFARQAQLKSAPADGFAAFVETVGLDPVRFAEDLADPAIEAMLAEDAALARTLGVSGTPASFVNGIFVRGAADATTFGPIIEEQRAKAQALVDAGTPPAAVYDELMKKAAKPGKAGA